MLDLHRIHVCSLSLPWVHSLMCSYVLPSPRRLAIALWRGPDSQPASRRSREMPDAAPTSRNPFSERSLLSPTAIICRCIMKTWVAYLTSGCVSGKEFHVFKWNDRNIWILSLLITSFSDHRSVSNRNDIEGNSLAHILVYSK